MAFISSLPRCRSHATSPVNMNPPRMTPSAEHLARNVCIEKTSLRYCLTGGQRSRGRPDKYALCHGACSQSVPCQRPIKAINTMRRAGHADKKPTTLNRIRLTPPSTMELTFQIAKSAGAAHAPRTGVAGQRSHAWMAERRQLRVSEALEGRSERPALGAWAAQNRCRRECPGWQLGHQTRASIDRKSQPEQNTRGCHRGQTGCRAALTPVGLLRKRDL